MNINNFKPLLRKSVLLKSTMPSTMYHTNNMNFSSNTNYQKKETKKINTQKTQKRTYIKQNLKSVSYNFKTKRVICTKFWEFQETLLNKKLEKHTKH
jgi:hypothetical protein